MLKRQRIPGRPAIHLGADAGWINDPNGLCFHKGVWHAFFQHNPHSDLHDDLHWGHAISTDLLDWEHLAVALAPDELGMIYSGSVVVDDENTAGFGSNALVAVFTHHLGGLERQSLAYSLDDGLTWTKYAGNPVLESSALDFRDPKVIRYIDGPRKRWVMVLAVGNRVDFYRSDDLREWEISGSYTHRLTTPGSWECPDLVEIRSDGASTWLLVFGVADGGIQGHSGTLVVRGHFNGETFDPSGPPSLLDHGPDFYAAQSFHRSAEPVVMGWINSWRYSADLPSDGRRGVLSLPRRLSLDRGDIQSSPAMDLALVGTPHASREWSSAPDRALRIRASGAVELTVRDTERDLLLLRLDERQLVVSRFEEDLPAYAQTYAVPANGVGAHEIVIDHGTFEVFADGGRLAFSALVQSGPQWAVSSDGDTDLTTISAHGSNIG